MRRTNFAIGTLGRRRRVRILVVDRRPVRHRERERQNDRVPPLAAVDGSSVRIGSLLVLHRSPPADVRGACASRGFRPTQDALPPDADTPASPGAEPRIPALPPAPKVPP